MPIVAGSAHLRQVARQNHASLRVDMAAIYRKTPDAGNADFGSDDVYTLIDIVPCSFWSAGGFEQLRMQMLDVRMLYKVALEGLINITEADQIVLTETHNGKIRHFSVTDAPDHTGELVKVVTCEEFPLMQGQVSNL